VHVHDVEDADRRANWSHTRSAPRGMAAQRRSTFACLPIAERGGNQTAHNARTCKSRCCL
jgi:hypothetical protein